MNTLLNGTLHDEEYIEIGVQDAQSVLEAMPNISRHLFWSMQKAASKEIHQVGVGYHGTGTYRNGYRLGWQRVWDNAWKERKTD